MSKWKTRLVSTARGTFEVFKEGIPHSTFVRFNESNHYPFLEEAHLFKMEIQQFMNKIL